MGDLYDEFVSVAELTGYGRQALEDDTDNAFTLSRFLPDQNIDDLRYRLENGPTGILDAADYRAYGAEPTFGRREGIRAIEGSLPPLGRQMTLPEFDNLVIRKAEEKVRDLLLRDSAKIANIMGRRMEVVRAQAMIEGRVVLRENGLSMTVEFDRSEEMEPDPADLWSDPDALILDELQGWKEAWQDANGGDPGVLFASERIIRAMLRNRQIVGAIRGDEVTARIRRSDLDSLLADESLPPLYTYNGRVQTVQEIGNTGEYQRVTRKIVPDHIVGMFPAPGDSRTDEGGPSGATLWGTTLEAQIPEYGIEAGEEPGIVVAAFLEKKTPVRVDTIGSAIGLPVVVNPDHFLVSPVLAPAA